MKQQLQQEAIILRKQGLSYSEVLKRIPVAKSTLSLWLRSVGLSKRQVQRLTKKRLTASRKGGQRKKDQRILKIQIIKQLARLEANKLSKDIHWIMGVMLYWAEGSKDKDYRPGQPVCFSNSDPIMIKIFIIWLKNYLRISDNRIILEIYIHENNKSRIEEVKQHWSKTTGFVIDKFDRIYFKKHKIDSKRKNRSNNYYGQLRIRIKESSSLNRQISGWIEGLCEQCGIV